jgi:hypothetical protein|tara:strand:+ start:541742 stop:542170 length:429 start_codon:yes stop_codon:yes gene_type:complete
MKNGTQRRTRSRGGRRNNTNNKSRVYDSNGPDVRIRGTATQIVEKYATLARDANAAGDIVAAQNFLQHAEHYQRIVNDWDDELINGPRKVVVHPVSNVSDSDTDDNFGNKVKPVEDDLGLPASLIGKEAVITTAKSMEVEPA